MLVHSRAIFVELGKAKAREGGAFAPGQQLDNSHWFELLCKGHMAAELLVRPLSDTAGVTGKKQVDMDTPR